VWSGEIATVKVRYKAPTATRSALSSFPVVDTNQAWQRASAEWKLAAGIAEMGMLLRASKYRGAATWTTAIELAKAAAGEDPHGYRNELLGLMARAERLSPVARR
jgi:Ca-activated chloride channel family protein